MGTRRARFRAFSATPEHSWALGLDTGCVYGGRLTAYSPELDEFASVAARRAWAAA